MCELAEARRLQNGQRHQICAGGLFGNSTRKAIGNGLHALLNAGYIPILAHVERYRSLHGKIPIIQSFWHDGVVLQADTQSLFRGLAYLFSVNAGSCCPLG